MKANIHPTWYSDAVVTCSCGATFTTGSQQKTIKVDICSKCHPFFTGEMRFVDTQGRVDKFMKKMEAAKLRQEEQADLRQRRHAKRMPNEKPEDFQSYKQLLQQQKQTIKIVNKVADTDDKAVKANK